MLILALVNRIDYLRGEFQAAATSVPAGAKLGNFRATLNQGQSRNPSLGPVKKGILDFQSSHFRALNTSTPVQVNAKREESIQKPPHSRGLDRPSHWGSSTKYNRSDAHHSAKLEKADLRVTPLFIARVPGTFSQLKSGSSSITPSPLSISFKPSWMKTESPADDPFERHVTNRPEPEVDVIDSTDFETVEIHNSKDNPISVDSTGLGTEPKSPSRYGYVESDALDSKKRSGKKNRRFGTLWTRVCRTESGNSTLWSAMAGSDLVDFTLKCFDLRDPRCVAKEAVDVTIIRRVETKQLPDFDIYLAKIEKFLTRTNNSAIYTTIDISKHNLQKGSNVLCFFTKGATSRFVDISDASAVHLRIYDFQIIKFEGSTENPFETLFGRKDNNSNFACKTPTYIMNSSSTNSEVCLQDGGLLSIIVCTNICHRVQDTVY